MTFSSKILGGIAHLVVDANLCASSAATMCRMEAETDFLRFRSSAAAAIRDSVSMLPVGMAGRPPETWERKGEGGGKCVGGSKV